MFKLAFRNIFRHRARTGLTLAAIVFGVAGLILSGGFVEDIFAQLREAVIHSQLGHLQVHKAGYSRLGRRDPYHYLMKDPRQLSAPLEHWPHVSDLMLRLNFSGLAGNGRADLRIIGEGIEADKEDRLGSFVTTTAGRQLADSDMFGIVLGQGVAQTLRLKPGDYTTILVTTPEGALNSLEFEVVGVFRSFSKEYDDHAVRILLSAAQELLATQGVHSLVFSLTDTEATDLLAERLRRVLDTNDYEVQTWYELADFYRKTVDLYRRQFGVLQLIILIMVLLSVANSVNMAIHERIGEFGTLMALGNRGSGIFRLVMTENVLLGLIGAGIGTIAGITLAWWVSSVGIPMPPPPNSNSGYTAFIRIVPSVVGMAFLVGFAATILAAILPARRAAHVPVVEALRQNI